DVVWDGVPSVADGVKPWHTAFSSPAWSPRWCSGMIRSTGGVLWSDPTRGGAPVTFNVGYLRHTCLGPPLSTSELLDERPERRRLTIVFVCGPLREFFGTTAYSLGVAVALPMLKGVVFRAVTVYVVLRTSPKGGVRASGR